MCGCYDFIDSPIVADTNAVDGVRAVKFLNAMRKWIGREGFDLSYNVGNNLPIKVLEFPEC